MTALADLITLEQRARGLANYVLTNISDSTVGVASTYYDVPSGQWVWGNQPQTYRDDTNISIAALLAALWALTKPRDQALLDKIANTVSRHIGHQSTTTKAGFWDNNQGAPGETSSSHGMVAFATCYDILKPFVSTRVSNAWLASIKAAVDQIWTTDGNGPGNGNLYWVNGNYDLAFEGMTRWYALRSGDAAYLAKADTWWDFLLNGTTTTTPTLTPDGTAIASLPAGTWPQANGNFGKTMFTHYGLWFSTPPTAADWSDGAGHFVEGASTPIVPTLTNSYDIGYSLLQESIAQGWWRVTGDARYGRIVAVIHNKNWPRVVLTPAGETRRPDNTTGAVNAVTGAISGTGGVVRLTVVGHDIVEGETVTVAAVGGVTAANGVRHAHVFDVDNIELTGSVFAGAYTSGGTVKAGNFIAMWNWNGWGGSRTNGQTANTGATLPALTWFSGIDRSAYLISQFSSIAPPSAATGLDGPIENNFQQYSTSVAAPGGYRAFGLELAQWLLWIGLARGAFRKDRVGM